MSGAGWIVAVLPALVLVAVAVPLAATAPDWPVHQHTTRAIAAAGVPGRVTSVVWTTRFAGPVHQVVAAGSGVVVELDDRVVAVDGRTGRLRWSYRRSNADPAGLVASPDGRYVAFDVGGLQLVVVDARTGQVAWTRADPFAFLSGGDPIYASTSAAGPATSLVALHVTAAGLISTSDVSRRVESWSWSNGSRSWSYSLSRGCSSESVGVPAGVLMTIGCDTAKRAGSVQLVAATSGTVRWDVTAPSSTDDSPFVIVDLSPDSRFATVAAHPTGTQLVYVIDTATGARLENSNLGPLLSDGLAADGPSGISRATIVRAAGGDQVAGQGPVSRCAIAGVVLHGATVLCPTVSRLPGARTVTLQSGALTGSVLTPLSPRITEPHALGNTGLSPGLRFTPAPGAVVVWPASTPLTHTGGISRIDGVR